MTPCDSTRLHMTPSKHRQYALALARLCHAPRRARASARCHSARRPRIMHEPLVPAWGAVGAVSNDAAVRNGAAAAPGPPRAAVASQACELPVTTGGSAVGAVGARIAAAAPAELRRGVYARSRLTPAALAVALLGSCAARPCAQKLTPQCRWTRAEAWPSGSSAYSAASSPASLSPAHPAGLPAPRLAGPFS